MLLVSGGVFMAVHMLFTLTLWLHFVILSWEELLLVHVALFHQ